MPNPNFSLLSIHTLPLNLSLHPGPCGPAQMSSQRDWNRPDASGVNWGLHLFRLVFLHDLSVSCFHLTSVESTGQNKQQKNTYYTILGGKNLARQRFEVLISTYLCYAFQYEYDMINQHQ